MNLVLSGCDAWGRPLIGQTALPAQPTYADVVAAQKRADLLSAGAGALVLGGGAKLLGASTLASLGLGVVGLPVGWLAYQLLSGKGIGIGYL